MFDWLPEKNANLGIGMMGLGQGLMGMSRGQSVNLAPYAAMIQQNRAKDAQDEAYRKAGEAIFGRGGAPIDNPALAAAKAVYDADPRMGLEMYANATKSASGFSGNSMDAQMYNVLMDPNASEQQRAAANHYFGKPKYQMIEGPDGPQLLAVPGQVPNLNGAQSAPDAAMRPTSPQIVAQGVEKPTEGMRAARGYLDRMNASEAIIQKFESEGYTSPTLFEKQAIGTSVEGFVLGEDDQQVLQAQRDWARAKLRKESGAVIGPQEMADEIRTYFPQPGDSEAVIKQKAEARKQAASQMRTAAGLDAPAPAQKPSISDISTEDLQRMLGGAQ